MSVQPPDPDLAHLSDMLTCARFAVEASRTIHRQSLTTFSGEAARNVSDQFKARHAEIPRRKIVATRNIVAHEYGRVNDDTIWKIVRVYLPELVLQLEPLVPSPMPDPEPETDP